MNIINSQLKNKITLETNFITKKTLSLAHIAISSFYEYFNSTVEKTKGCILEDIITSVYNNEKLSYASGTTIIDFKEAIDIAEVIIFAIGFETLYFNNNREQYIKDIKNYLKAKINPKEKYEIKYLDAVQQLVVSYENNCDSEEFLGAFYYYLIKRTLQEKDFTQCCLIDSKKIELFLKYSILYNEIIILMIRKSMFYEVELSSYINPENNKKFDEEIIFLLDEYNSKKKER